MTFANPFHYFAAAVFPHYNRYNPVHRIGLCVLLVAMTAMGFGIQRGIRSSHSPAGEGIGEALQTVGAGLFIALLFQALQQLQPSRTAVPAATPRPSGEMITRRRGSEVSIAVSPAPARPPETNIDFFMRQLRSAAVPLKLFIAMSLGYGTQKAMRLTDSPAAAGAGEALQTVGTATLLATITLAIKQTLKAYKTWKKNQRNRAQQRRAQVTPSLALARALAPVTPGSPTTSRQNPFFRSPSLAASGKPRALSRGFGSPKATTGRGPASLASPTHGGERLPVTPPALAVPATPAFAAGSPRGRGRRPPDTANPAERTRGLPVSPKGRHGGLTPTHGGGASAPATPRASTHFPATGLSARRPKAMIPGGINLSSTPTHAAQSSPASPSPLAVHIGGVSPAMAAIEAAGTAIPSQLAIRTSSAVKAAPPSSKRALTVVRLPPAGTAAPPSAAAPTSALVLHHYSTSRRAVLTVVASPTGGTTPTGTG